MEKIPLTQMGKPVLEIWEGPNKKTIPLNRQSRKYIHVTLNHHIKTYDSNGELNHIINKYPM